MFRKKFKFSKKRIIIFIVAYVIMIFGYLIYRKSVEIERLKTDLAKNYVKQSSNNRKDNHV